MSNKNRKDEVSQNDSSEKSEYTVRQVPAAIVPPQPVIIMTFDRWFQSTGRPAHHKVGMEAFIRGKASGKRSATAWAGLFENY